MMASRLNPKATVEESSTQLPASSGPRCWRRAAMPSATRPMSGAALVLPITPANPHMLAPFPFEPRRPPRLPGRPVAVRKADFQAVFCLNECEGADAATTLADVAVLRGSCKIAGIPPAVRSGQRQGAQGAGGPPYRLLRRRRDSREGRG